MPQNNPYLAQNNPYLQSDKDRIANIGKVYKSNSEYTDKIPTFDANNSSGMTNEIYQLQMKKKELNKQSKDIEKL